MDSDELDCLINQNSKVSSRYTGQIYSYDNLPAKLNKGYFYIVNDKSYKSNFDIPGHWICLYYELSNNYVHYVDSFGLPVEPQFVTPLLEKTDASIFYMNYCLQNIETSSCALHSLTFATLFCFDWDVTEILENCYDIFNSKAKLNPFFFDEIAQKFVYDFYGESRSIFYEF